METGLPEAGAGPWFRSRGWTTVDDYRCQVAGGGERYPWVTQTRR